MFYPRFSFAFIRYGDGNLGGRRGDGVEEQWQVDTDARQQAPLQAAPQARHERHACGRDTAEEAARKENFSHCFIITVRHEYHMSPPPFPYHLKEPGTAALPAKGAAGCDGRTCASRHIW